MVSKIISGGQTGVDRAALDTAMKLGISHGGWAPKGRRAEDGVIPETYRLRETASYSYSRRTERNVMEADGTLLISRGQLRGGSRLTRKMAVKHGRPWLHVDLEKMDPFEGGQKALEWINRHKIRVLNVAGPRTSEDPEIYLLASGILRTLFFLDMVQSVLSDSDRSDPQHPRSVEEAVDRLISELSLRERARLARLKKEQLIILFPAVGEYIRKKFGLQGCNRALMEDCRLELEGDILHEGDVSAFILVEMWKRLRETHRLRVVK